MTQTPKDIQEFIEHLQDQLTRLDPEHRAKAMQIIQDLIKLAKTQSDQIH